MTVRSDAAFFDDILEHLRQTRGFDFTAYKRASLMRRVMKRMQVVQVDSFEQYLDYLQVHHDEFAALFNTILINVTSFFRDADLWSYLAEDVLPVLLADRSPADPLRIWSAGSASGQEAYTVAMLAAELLGTEDIRDRVKIYATDVDGEALNEARHATYSARHVTEVPAPLFAKYFEQAGTEYNLKRELRRAVIFGRHDLIQDAPISRIDLLLCRNTLMYFNAEAQTAILSRFYFSLNPGGYLVLGRAEMLFSHAAMFTPVDLKRRVFRGVPKAASRDRLLVLPQGRERGTGDKPDHVPLQQAAFDSGGVAEIILDGMGTVVAANAPARRLFGVGPQDVGRPLQDLQLSYRPTELRSALERALHDRRDVTLAGVPWTVAGESRTLDIVLSPLENADRELLGARISFVDVTRYKSLQDELQHSRQELETAYEELQSTNEELETTNEELQSTVEELETTNEELQSTNEELETMNEELQSTNEELQTMNDELRDRGTELNSANAFLESVFTSLRSAVIIVDRDYRVQVWNNRAEDLWGLRGDEVQGAHFLGLDIGLPVEELKLAVRGVLAGSEEHTEATLHATSRRGRAITCHVSVTPLKQRDRTISGVILLMEEKQVQV
jgi:two-component system, chemotaxis family, CheB/CheR fusion protein